MSIEISRLSNGLQIITDTIPHVETAVAGIWCRTGARYETPEVNGLAHFFEHMMFKGTKHRTTTKIAEEMEDIGASMNAFTSYDVTAYHFHSLKDDVEKGFDIYADMILNAAFPQSELDTERNVVIQEIAMYEDTPDEHVFDLAQLVAFPDQALGRPILGTRENVSGFTRQNLQDYQQALMNPSNMAVSMTGNVAHKKMVELAERYFSHLKSADKNTALPAHYMGGELITPKPVEQVQIVLKFEGLNRNAHDLYALKIFSTLFGGGMSSRLFQEVRDKRGLVYSVYSFISTYEDTGVFGIYAGTSAEQANEAVAVSLEELKKCIGTISDAELQRAKAQDRAKLLFSQESLLRRANDQARHLIYFDKAPDLEARIKRINDVTKEDIEKVITQLLSSKLSRTILGNVQGVEDYETSLNRLKS